ncbi:hypothetical protein [Pseudomonas phage PA1C]|uniref:Uncharacterized protein n=2 Tax=root TaxID=1 RepID=A0A5C1K7H3_9CAUD|nr:hypothetical protein PP933_gp338 [Pseudomonas phage vB_PaeM_PS119XW]QBX32494.1 hypothetical protein [Pseudomonas phage PA1C]QEM42067.1 hypothetical protein [Pseudomonas phage vB_PaeM_PS119XW]
MSNVVDVAGTVSGMAIQPNNPVFEMSHVLEQKVADIQKAIVNQFEGNDYVIYTRRADELPQARFTIGLGRTGLPEFVTMGLTEKDYVRDIFRAAAVAADTVDIEERDLYNAGDWADYLNEKLLSTKNLRYYYRFIPIDSEQFMHGVGLNCGRFYGPNSDRVRVVQLIYSLDGYFPDEEGYPSNLIDQPILPQIPYGYPHRASARFADTDNRWLN